MKEINCKHEKDSSIILHENGMISCVNLSKNSATKREYWKCKITNEYCGYNNYKTPENSLGFSIMDQF